jgi:hypothetical protein
MPDSVPAPPAAAPAVAGFLSRLTVAPPQAHGALTLWPLQAPAPGREALAYRTLREARVQGAVVVEELRNGAAVPQVLVDNRGELAVLALFGEQLQGAFQNRTVNASFLVPAHAQLELDVSCVEAGRWQGRPTFRGTSAVIAHAIRRRMERAVRASRQRGRRFQADQHEVWDEVERRLTHSGVESASRAYADYVEAHREALVAAAAGFHPTRNQVGFVAAIGGAVVGLEAIGRPEVFAAAFPGLLDAYLVDALEPAEPTPAAGAPPRPAFADPAAFLLALAAAPAQEGPSLGLGQDVRLGDDRVRGCALVAGDLVHLTAFAEGEAQVGQWYRGR